MMKGFAVALTGATLTLFAQGSYAYGEEGHSIIAEIAQRRLTPSAQAEVGRVLGGGSMASVASWPDDVRYPPTDPDSNFPYYPESYNWHFVDIPRAEQHYLASRDCQVKAGGDCAIAELERLRKQLCSPSDDVRKNALRYTIHFVGDVHQPLHTVLELTGANFQYIEGTIHNSDVCKNGCKIADGDNLHAYWDTGLIRMAYYDWGAYVVDLEAGILKDPDIQRLGREPDPVAWVETTHEVVGQIWSTKLVVDAKAAHKGTVILDDAYYAMSKPILDKQLALAGLRLAKFLNTSYADPSCGAAPPPNLGLVKMQIKPYYTGKVKDGKTQYELDQEEVAGAAKEYLLSRLSDATLAKPAVVLDIDETSLNNLGQMQMNDFGYIQYGPCTLESGYACGTLGTKDQNGRDGWDGQGKAIAIAATKALFDTAINHHVAVFFITGRRESEDQATRDNLEHAGYAGFTHLYLRPAASVGNVGLYKAATRAKIEADGYHIVVNLGDQPSDLVGGHAEQSFQMPDPFYYLP